MRCDISFELLSAYLDGELEGTDRLRVEEHLKSCARCRAELEEMRTGDELVRQRPVAEPSNKFLLGFENRIVAQLRPKARWSWFWRIAPVLTPVAVAAITVLVVLTGQEKTAPMVGLPEIVPLVFEAEKNEDKDDRAVTGLMKKAEAPALARSPETKAGGELAPSREAPAVAERSTAVPAAPAASVMADFRDDEAEYKAEETRIQATLTELNIPKNKVVRAIVDSTGRVVRVATGNTIQPEEDSMLEVQLEGQQIAPRSFSRKQNLMYLDLTQQAQPDTAAPESLKAGE